MSTVQTPLLKIKSYSQAPNQLSLKLKSPLLGSLYLSQINLVLITSNTPVTGYVTIGNPQAHPPFGGAAYLQVNAATYSFVEHKLNALSTQPFSIQLTYDNVTLAVSSISTTVVASALAMESSLRELILRLTPGGDSAPPPAAYSEPPPASEDELPPYYSSEEQSAS